MGTLSSVILLLVTIIENQALSIIQINKPFLFTVLLETYEHTSICQKPSQAYHGRQIEGFFLAKRPSDGCQDSQKEVMLI